MIKTNLTTEKRLKRRSYIKYRWDSKINDHNREAFRFIKDKDISPQVTSIVEQMESELHPCGRKMDGYWTYQTMANHDPTAFAANSTIRCKANLQPEPTYFVPHPKHHGLWLHERRFTKPIAVQFEWTEFNP